jgi:hypothetical protein
MASVTKLIREAEAVLAERGAQGVRAAKGKLREAFQLSAQKTSAKLKDVEAVKEHLNVTKTVRKVQAKIERLVERVKAKG